MTMRLAALSRLRGREGAASYLGIRSSLEGCGRAVKHFDGGARSRRSAQCGG
jgi:hypothetical protein